MTYVHGLGDAQERMTYDDYTPTAPKCKCCGATTEYDFERHEGTVNVYVFLCPDEDCEMFEEEQTVEEDLDDLYDDYDY